MLDSTTAIIPMLMFLVGAGATAQPRLPGQERTAVREAPERRDELGPLQQEREPVQRESSSASGLARLFADELAGVDEVVIRSLPLTRAVIWSGSHTLGVREVVSRSLRVRGQNGMKTTRLFVEVWCENLGPLSWLATGATLSAGGEALEGVSVWQSEPLATGKTGMVMVEVKVDATAAQARSTFTLTLSDESGRRLLTLENVRFP
ncbi:MAG TPA: DUF2381 family protein [Myxococcaceae bacterium]|nr:DUF2381 family protein [Myxococcaceae bacterium]